MAKISISSKTCWRDAVITINGELVQGVTAASISIDAGSLATLHVAEFLKELCADRHTTYTVTSFTIEAETVT